MKITLVHGHRHRSESIGTDLTACNIDINEVFEIFLGGEGLHENYTSGHRHRSESIPKVSKAVFISSAIRTFLAPRRSS